MHSIGRGTIDLLADTVMVALIANTYKTDVEWPAWQSVHAYLVGEIVRPTSPDGHAFECTVAGNSDSSEPSPWNESAGGGSTTTDDGVTWTDLGINPPLYESPNVGFISLPTVWSVSKVVTQFDFYVPLASPNGHVYEATTGGTADTVEPTWPTDRTTVADGSVIWTDRGMNPGANEVTGTGYVQQGEEILTKTLTNVPLLGRRTFWDGVDVTWATSTITARYGQIYKLGVADSVINPLIGLVLFNDAPADVGSVAADFIIKWNTEGILRLRATLI
jgi:hypothetical protein